MHIDKPQHRPVQDQACPQLQIARGCTHGKCHFCTIYHGVPFSASPMSEILEDIDEISRTSVMPPLRIYLTGGNPFALSNERLAEIFTEVRKVMPSVKTFGGFCRILDIKAKTDEELAELAALGVDDVTIGAETGYDPALAFMEKGHTAADIVEQGQRLHAAGIRFTFFYLAGIAGASKGQENAEAAARVFSAAAPQRILIMTLTPSKGWQLADDIAAGAWAPETEVETAEEIRTFVAGLTCETYVNCSHDTDIVRFDALIPKDQANALLLLDHTIPNIDEEDARELRGFINRATF